MSFEMGISLFLGEKYKNCTTLSAQLISSNGSNYNSPYTNGFINLTNGNFLFTPTIPTSFKGAIKFYCGNEFIGVLSVNPQEYENIDVKISTRCSSTGNGVPTLTNPIPINPENPIELRLTDDYLVQESRSIDITSINWPDLTGSTTNFILDSRLSFIKQASLLNNTSLRIELTNQELMSIGAGRWSYEFRSILSNGHRITLAVGNIVIVPPFAD